MKYFKKNRREPPGRSVRFELIVRLLGDIDPYLIGKGILFGSADGGWDYPDPATVC